MLLTSLHTVCTLQDEGSKTEKEQMATIFKLTKEIKRVRQELQDLNSDLNELWDDLCEELSFHLTLQADIRRLWYAVSLFRYFHGDEFEDFILDSDYEELGTFMFGDEFGSLGWRMQIAWNCMVDGFHMCITLGRVKSDVETLMSNGQWCLALDRIRVLQHGCQLGQGALEAAQDHHDIAEGMLDVAWDEWWIFLDALVDYYDWLAEQAADEIIVIIPTNGAPYWSDIADALDWIINGD